jgi:hypothetical protein
MTDNQSFSQFMTSLAPNGVGDPSYAPILARVAHVIQGPNFVGTNIPDPYYDNPTDIGSITFQVLNSNQSSTLSSTGNVPAKPINSAFKQIPVEGEIVYVIPGPSVDMNENAQRQDFYYLQPYNLWNAANNNAFPNMQDYSGYINKILRSYEDSMDTKQAINTSVTSSLIFPLGPNFPQKADIRTLRQFTGDVTLEGRWGNSIRFGSTTALNGFENYWSATGSAGDPITIIRNGQGKQSSNLKNWFPTVEDINRDLSSIYLTAGQKIQIDDLSNFSLTSLSVKLQDTRTNAIPIQQQLTSTNTLSAQEQDERINRINN